MTLKKFLKKYIDAFADIYNNGEYLGQSLALDKKYKEWKVDKVFPAYSKSDLRCGIVAINIEPPKEKKLKKKDYKCDNCEYRINGECEVIDVRTATEEFSHYIPGFDTVCKKDNPKRSTHNKAYKKWMKKYVKEHLDEIGLKDGEDAMD